MYNQGSGRQGNVTNQENVNKIVKCFRCGKTGHMISECRWANGTCFSCGQVGHMAMNCTDPQRSGCRIEGVEVKITGCVTVLRE
ncbi:Gag-Pol polyprotein [Armadillidium vulgare]|nr:Gag-Pol polyprotein [Armadillidium vulgare]